MTIHTLVYAAFAIELVLFLYVFVAYFRERSALRVFVETATQPERLKDIAKSLPAAYRAPATQFAGDLSRKGQLDEILSYAITKTANTPFGFGPLIRVVVALSVSALVFTPLALAMVRTAAGISLARARIQSLSGAQVFLIAKSAMDPAFASLRWAFDWSALLLAGIICVSALHWWLNRAEAREARFVMALIESAIIARPGASAPVSGRLTELIAPDRSLKLPIAAFTFFFGASTGGWALLYFTADVKKANAAEVYNVWPRDDRERAVTAPAGMDVPSMKGGGLPIKAGNVLTMTIAKKEAGFGDQRPIITYEKDQPLPPDWRKKANLWTSQVDTFVENGRLELFVLADRDIPASLALELFDLIRTTYRSTRANLVFRRGVQLEGAKVTFQSRIMLDLSPPEDKALIWLKLAVDGNKIRIDPAPEGSRLLDRSDPEWMKKLSNIVRAGLAEQKAPGFIALAVDGKVPWGTLLEVLSAADNTCEDQDCGVQGLGLQFVLAP
jgi:hypothetical protein